MLYRSAVIGEKELESTSILKKSTQLQRQSEIKGIMISSEGKRSPKARCSGSLPTWSVRLIILT